MKLYTADRVLTQGSAGAIEAGAVLVDGENIIWVGRYANFPANDFPSDTQTRHLGSATLLPGLIDAHVHLAFDGGPNPVARMKAENDAQQVALMLRSARELLSVGVTTARDLGARGYLDIPVRDAIVDGTARGPRMLTAGAPITVTGGHCWFMDGEADAEDDVRRMVRRHHKMGVDLIKIMSTGGFMTAGSAPWFAQFGEQQMRAAVEEAHRLGKKIAAHAHGVQGIERALAAGVDTLEHCSFVHEDGHHEVVPKLADRIAASESYVSPTANFRVSEMIAMSDGAFTPALPELYSRGVKIIASTDSGIDNVPHYGFVGALEAMREMGLPAEEVLTSATSRSAEALGLADVTGRLAVGLSADLIALGGDPRASISALRDLRLVVSRGVEFIPDLLPPIAPLERSRFGGRARSDAGARNATSTR